MRAVEYRLYWIMGKGVILFALFFSTLVIHGLNKAQDFALWWLFFIPAGLLACLFWRGFPAFCRCPGCRKRMESRSKDGAVIPSGRFSNNVSPTKHYLVCDSCMLYIFLGETGDAE